MVDNLHGRLVNATTRDGVRLHGFLSEAQGSSSVWMLVHGVNSNFYSSSLLQHLALAARREGESVLLLNTRGHDILGFNSGPVPARTGSQIESLMRCLDDLDAWADFLMESGFSSISVMGHSLGAIKSLIWSADRHLAKRLVCVSPPRLNTQVLSQDPKNGDVFLKTLRDAEVLCEANKHDQVMKVRFPLPMWICASTYLDKYGSGDRYDYVAMARSNTVPTLWTFGSSEMESRSASFHDADQVLRIEIAQKEIPNQSVQVVQGANHAYHQCEVELASRWLHWLNSKTE